MTSDHASLSRRSTAPAPNRARHLQHLGAHYVFFHVLHINRDFLLTLSSSYVAVCSHHLSPRNAIVFSLLSSVLKFSMYTLVYFLIRSSNTPRSSLYSSRFTFSYGVSSTLICFATRAHLCIFLVLPTTGTVISSFWHIQPGPPHEIAASAISRSPLGRGGDRPRSALHASLEPSVLMQSSLLTVLPLLTEAASAQPCHVF